MKKVYLVKLLMPVFGVLLALSSLHGQADRIAREAAQKEQLRQQRRATLGELEQRQTPNPTPAPDPTEFQIQAAFDACPAVNAGPDVTTCAGGCVNLTAAPVSGFQTTSYALAPIAYTPFPFTAGTQILVGTDDIWSGVINLPFDFCYFGGTFNQCVIGANGCISFDLSYANQYNAWPINTAFPGNNDARNSICAPFHDMDPSEGGQIYYNISGTAPCRSLSVTWYQIPMYDCTNLIATQQIVLYETTNIIETYIQNKPTCGGWNSGRAIHGIQNANATQAFVVPNRNSPTQWSTSNDGWRFTPNGATNFTVSWFDGATPIGSGTNIQVCPAATTTYTAQAVYTNCNNATVTVDDDVTVNTFTLTATASGTAASCTAPGSLFVNVIGGLPPFTYNIGAGPQVSNNGNFSFGGLQPGSYNVTVVDGQGCTATTQGTISAPGAPTALASAPSSLTCTTTSLTLSGAGSSTGGNFSYQWTGPGIQSGSNTLSPVVTQPGTYTLTVTNTTSGCTVSASAVVTQNNTTPTASAATTSALNCAQSQVEVSGAGSSNGPNFTAQWTGPGIVSGATSLLPIVNQAGAYNLLITDITNGCTATASATVTSNTTLPTAVVAQSLPITCTDTVVTLSGTGSSTGPDITYVWSGPGLASAGNAITTTANLGGSYTLIVNNTSNFCTASASTTVLVDNALPTAVANAPVSLTCTATSVQLDGSGSSAGAGFTYAWSGPSVVAGSATLTPTVNQPGAYGLIVTNTVNGCTQTATATLASNTAAPTVSIASPADLTCANPTIALDASGSTTLSGSASYQWNGPGLASGTNTASPFVDEPGTYFVTVTDTQNGCTAVGQTTVAQSGVPTISAIANNPGCDPNGNVITVTVNGGTAPYSYDIGFGAQSSNIFNSVVAGTYTVVVTDDLGCIVNTTVTVPPTPVLGAPALSSNSPVCESSLILLGSVAPAGVTYAWSGPNGFASSSPNPNVPLATIANQGLYVLVITDVNGCTSTASTYVQVNQNGTVAIDTPIDFCTNSGQAWLTASPAGGTWSGDVSAVGSFFPGTLGAGTFVAYYTYNSPNGCNVTQSVLFNIYDCSCAANDTICEGAPVIITSSGGSAGYTQVYYLVDAITNIVLDSNSTGNFTNTVVAGNSYRVHALNFEPTDAPSPLPIIGLPIGDFGFTHRGCFNTDFLSDYYCFFVEPTPSFTLSNSSPVCEGGNVTLSVTEVLGATYNWAGPAGFSANGPVTQIQGVTVASAGVYNLTVTTLGGCTYTDATIVSIGAGPVVNVLGPIDYCTNAGLSWLYATPQGGTWSGSVSANGAFEPAALGAGTFQATYVYTDNNGCVAEALSTFNVGQCNCVTRDTVCFGEPAITSIAASNPAYTQLYVLKDPISGTVIAVNNTGDFTSSVQAGGFYNVHALSYDAANAPSPLPAVGLPAGNFGFSNFGLFDANYLSNFVCLFVSEVPTVQVSNSGPVCAGQSVTLTSSGGNFSSYSWSGPAGFASNLGNPTLSNATTAMSGTYTVTATNQSGCTTTASTQITVFDTPVSTASSNDIPCMNATDDVVLTATVTGGTAPYTYYWSTPTGGAITSSVASVLFPNASQVSPGVYSLVVVDANGCTSGIDTTLVDINLSPSQPVINGPSGVCAGTATTLTTQTYVGSNVTYTWTLPNASTQVTTNPSLNLVSPLTGTYQVVVNVAGCNSSAGTFSLVVHPVPTLLATSDDLECMDPTDDITLTATVQGGTGPFVYYWTGPNNFNLITQDNEVVFPNAINAYAGTYNVYAVDANGCQTLMDTTVIDATVAPQQPIVSGPAAVCAGQLVTLSVPVYSGNTVSYTWLLPNGASYTSGDNTYTMLNVQAAVQGGTYRVIVVVDGCTSDTSAAFTLTIDPRPSITAISGGGAYCQGANVTLASTVNTGGANVTYLWTGPNGFSATTPDVVFSNVQPAQSGSYRLEVFSNAGCASEPVVVNLTVTPRPDVPSLTSNSPVCIGETIALGTTPVNGTTVTYDWYFNGTLLGSTNIAQYLIPAATPAQNGAYSVVVNVDGCISIPSVPGNVQVGAFPSLQASSNSPVCPGTDLALDATFNAGLSYQWSGPAGFTSTLRNPIIPAITPFNAGTYYVLVIDNATGCSSADTIVVAIVPSATDIAFAGIDQALCDVNTATLTALAPVTPGVTGRWEQTVFQAGQGVTITSPAALTTGVNGLLPGNTYRFVWVLTNADCGDFSWDTVSVTSDILPTLQAYAGETDFACATYLFNLDAVSPSIGIGLWSQQVTQAQAGVIIVSPNDANTLVANLLPGENVFYWTLSNGACVDYSSDSVMIVREEAIPTANIDSVFVPFDIVTGEGGVTGIDLLLNDDVTTVTSYTVSIVDAPNHGILTQNASGTWDFTTNLNYYGRDTFIYQICAGNCPDLCDTAMVILKIGEFNDCFVPNIFTPNGDGVNDFLIVPCLGNYPNNELSVFNRWGDEVFRAIGYSNDWTGTFNGADLPDGSYYYILKLNDADETILQGYTVIHR